MFSTIILSALMGWTGGSFTSSINPDPSPWKWTVRISTSIIGGLIGGYVASQFVGAEQLVTTGLLAMAGGSILTDLGRQINVVR